ncbi:hypothetical protein E2C01_043456 [Portunus trituberculatus]|uniref:Uncharacterized protein n=1 Tax=Portunus trituberculatus TaxID=210409 RepID=A0A5B7FW73_PORTR|nr:hypothetical protein [Portunus trituberculatus]
MMTKIRVAFQFMDKDLMKNIIMSMICPKLELNSKKRYKKIRTDPEDRCK